jgi:hypothetical protein
MLRLECDWWEILMLEEKLVQCQLERLELEPV